MSATVGILQYDGITPLSILHTTHIQRTSNSVRLIRRHRSYVVLGHCDLPSVRTCPIPCRALSHEAPFCSAPLPPFTRQEFAPLHVISVILISLSTFLPFEVGLGIWLQSSHPAWPRPSSVPGANMMPVWSSHIARVWVNRVRLPILHVVS